MMPDHLNAVQCASQLSKVLADLLSLGGHDFLVAITTPFHSHGNQHLEGNTKAFLQCGHLTEVEGDANILHQSRGPPRCSR